jgi:hypothetical protein
MARCPIDRTEGDRPTPGTLAWWFTDRRTGRIVIVQAPNLPLVVWGMAEVVSLSLRGHPAAGATAGDIARGALLVWALDEIGRGVNPYRRVLGAVVLAVTIWSLAGG